MDKIERDKKKKHILKILPKYLRNFYGFGNPKANIWFVGMEPGGGNSPKEIRELLISWKNCGSKEYVDIFKFHEKIKKSKHCKPGKYPNLAKYFFDKNNKLQSTWNKLILIINPKSTTEDRREFQKLYFGRNQSDNCLIELFPLPAPKTSEWKYNVWFKDIPYLKNKGEYKKKFLKERKEFIKKQISKHKPKVVVFYGKGYLNAWEDISGCEFRNNPFQEKNNILFVAIKHPVYKPSKSKPNEKPMEYFKDIGIEINKRIRLGA
jgi:uracil-DNA glycosylase